MKKLKLNSTLEHKSSGYSPYNIEVAEFICKHGQSVDVRITTNDGFELLDTFGIYINKISDMEYRQELLKVLIPMQHEVENAAFLDDEDMDKTEDMDMTM